MDTLTRHDHGLGRNEIDNFADPGIGRDPPGGFSPDPADQGSGFESAGGVDLGLLAEGLDFSDIFPEEDSLGAHDLDEAPFDAAISHIQKSKPRGNRKKELESFSEEDFDGAQRKAFIVIRHYKNLIFRKTAKPQEIFESANFIFGRTYEDELNFDMCCEVLEARRDVLRLRFHYEFYLRWMVFPAEFPFMIDPLPYRIDNEIIYHVGERGRALAYEAWAQPGITTNEMILRAFEIERIEDAPKDTMKMLEILESHYIMSRQGDNWYLTGRNPLMHRMDRTIYRKPGTGGTLNWARLW